MIALKLKIKLGKLFIKLLDNKNYIGWWKAYWWIMIRSTKIIFMSTKHVNRIKNWQPTANVGPMRKQTRLRFTIHWWKWTLFFFSCSSCICQCLRPHAPPSYNICFYILFFQILLFYHGACGVLNRQIWISAWLPCLDFLNLRFNISNWTCSCGRRRV